jgi:hypothetical protein
MELNELDQARQRQMESVEAERKAGGPVTNIWFGELEVLRIDILQGRVRIALPKVIAVLSQARDLWWKYNSGRLFPETPDKEIIARLFISALDIAWLGHVDLRDWPAALACAEESLSVKKAMGRPSQDIAIGRLNHANALKGIGNLDAALAELNLCLDFFRDDPKLRAITRSSVAALLYEKKTFREPWLRNDLHWFSGLRTGIPQTWPHHTIIWDTICSVVIRSPPSLKPFFICWRR